MEVQAKYNEMADLRKQEESHLHLIRKAEDDLAAAEIELSNCPVYEPPRGELVSLN